ncbi:MAG TPA: hypothetical protein VK452_00970 [Dissulfurispiraceae bacterium]|nr:hypothetical protein [Dissulfurispiraceae bacterium]
MPDEKLIHDLIVDNLRQKLAREYKEISINSAGNPDLVLANHGLVLANVEVETDNSITHERADMWKTLSQPGIKLILMVPKNAKAKVTELLWQKGIMDKVSVGSYEIVINMP